MPATKQKDNIDRLLNWSYPHQEALSIPAKLSVTEIKQQLLQLIMLLKMIMLKRYLLKTSFKRPTILAKTNENDCYRIR